MLTSLSYVMQQQLYTAINNNEWLQWGDWKSNIALGLKFGKCVNLWQDKMFDKSIHFQFLVFEQYLL